MHSNQDEVTGENDRSHAPRKEWHATAAEAVSRLSDDELLAGTRRLVCLSNRVLAALLTHLAEVEARGLHRARACASLFTYCIYELRMSEDAAFRRVAAARLVKRFPQLLEAVERGELHLTALLLLGPHLTEVNVSEVTARARFRTKKEVVKLVRLLSPLPDIPSRIEPLGLERPRLRPTWGNLLAARHPVRDLPPYQHPANWLPASKDVTHHVTNELTALPFAAPAAGPPCDGARDLADAPDDLVHAPSDLVDAPNALVHAPSHLVDAPNENVEQPTDLVHAPERLVDPPTESGSPEPPPPAPLDPAMTLSGAQRYSVQFTASEEYVALVEEAKALLAHALPSATLAELHLRAMRSLVAALKKRKFAQSNQSSRRSKSVGPAPQRDTPTDSPRTPRQRDAAIDSSRDAPTDSPRQRDAAIDSSRDALTDSPHQRDTPADSSRQRDAAAPQRNTPTDSPRQRDPLTDSPQRGRAVPAAVRRAVFERDGHRCAYIDARGVRCRETERLELHHHQPFARGGPSTAENLSLSAQLTTHSPPSTTSGGSGSSPSARTVRTSPNGRSHATRIRMGEGSRGPARPLGRAT